MYFSILSVYICKIHGRFVGLSSDFLGGDSILYITIQKETDYFNGVEGVYFPIEGNTSRMLKLNQ